MIKKGTDAMNQIYATVSRVLNSTQAGKDLLSRSAHVEQKLAYHIARDLGLVCSYDGEDGEGWVNGCQRPPRAKGLCMEHYQMKYNKGWYKREK